MLVFIWLMPAYTQETLCYWGKARLRFVRKPWADLDFRSWPGENVSAQTKRAVAVAMQITIGDIGAIAG